jgi:hypothetical protein
MKLFVFQFDISGRNCKDLHSKNKYLTFLTLLVFHLEISGKDFNDEQF